MKRILAFADRNRKEILRDPLSYIFCLAFPLVMLAVMTLVTARQMSRKRELTWI